jgi:chorismate mutase
VKIIKELPKDVKKKLEKCRKAVDRADKEILKALQKRHQAVEQVGAVKRKHKLPIVQPERWKEVVENRVARGNKLKLHEPFLREVLDLIHKESVRIQERGKK